MLPVNCTDGHQDFFDSLDCAHQQEQITTESHVKPVATIVNYENLTKLETFEDALATTQLKQAMVETTGFVTAVELLKMRSILPGEAIANDS
ncbi:hypothetical protein [Chamaesiphon minutus]|uniref:Uncharacterized protein n=1 Tax=Chamaesiphon minutus (strain ATCC 27169 / PCC 6605) TaxID=1173020 RepID=K9UIX6_CHAP6|nr:hypothetical protein [Chamaesiphon minutus]AFY94381.1 hypothetical protein Cha6605_3381 [Chamaesiphon minutus PCC 6605]